MRVSHMKMDDINSDLGIPNKIVDIIYKAEMTRSHGI